MPTFIGKQISIDNHVFCERSCIHVCLEWCSFQKRIQEREVYNHSRLISPSLDLLGIYFLNLFDIFWDVILQTEQ